MGRSGIEKPSFVLLLIADAFIQQMIPDEATAAEGLPDEDLLLHGRVYTELHAPGDGHFPISSPSLLVNCFGHGMSIAYKCL